MSENHRSLNALPVVAATAAAVVLASGCSSSSQTAADQHPSITFGSEASATPGMEAGGTPGTASAAASPSQTESSTAAAPVQLPAAGEKVAFESHIKPLFRESDRKSMKFAFDLWNYNDVKTNASAIADRLKDGSMPCDGAWSPQQIDVFQRWIDSGMADT